MLKRVEGDDADRIVELPRHQIGDDGFEVCPLDVGLAVGGAKAAKAVDADGGWCSKRDALIASCLLLSDSPNTECLETKEATY